MKAILTSKNRIDFKQNIKNLSTKEKGDAFELIVKYYLLFDPKYRSLLTNVWLYDEIPSSIHRKLNLPEKDMGKDLIAETRGNQFWAIQCKYRDNEQKQITWHELSTFDGLAFSNKNISYALLCATTEKITKVIDRIDNLGVRTIEVWRHLDKDFFERIKSFIKQKPAKLALRYGE